MTSTRWGSSATRRSSVTGANPVEIAFAHVEQPLPPLPDHVPHAVRELVAAMLAKDPADRPRSAAAVARTAEEILDATTTAEPASRRATSPAGGEPAGGRAPATPADRAPARDTPRAVPFVTPPTGPSPAPGGPADRPATVTRRALHRPAPRATWRRPTWRELAADRRWLAVVGAGVVLVIVLLAVLIGTLAVSEALPAGTGRHQTTDQPN